MTVEQNGDASLEISVIGGWRWAHNHMAEAVGFDSTLDFRKLRVFGQLIPSAEIELRLRPLGGQLYCQGVAMERAYQPTRR